MRLKFSLLALAVVFLGSTALYAQQGFLLIPDSDDGVVGAYSPFDGSLSEENFLVGNTELSLPINAIDSGNGTILLSDQAFDRVYEYGFNGTFLGIALDEKTGINNVRGITLNNGGDLLAAIGIGQFGETVQRFDLQGGQETVVAGVNPFDVLVRDNDILVSNIAGDEQVESYDFDGNLNFVFESNIQFPEQICETANGQILVAGFDPPAGIYMYNSAGFQIDFWGVGPVRGVYQLGNGNILYTTGNGVFSLNPNTDESETIVTGGSYRFIEAIGVDDDDDGGGINVTTTASELDVFRGIQRSGTLADSFTSDDSRLTFNPGFTIGDFESPVWLIFDGSLADIPASLSITTESNAGTPGITVTTEAFNFTSNSYDVVNVRNEIFNSDSVTTTTITPGNYVDTDGSIRTRLGWRRTGFTVNFPWEVRVDQVVWNSSN